MKMMNQKLLRTSRLVLCFFSLGISRRTLQRCKSNYKSSGLWGIRLKQIHGRKAECLCDEIQSLITEIREKFRWGSEVIRMHLLLDHCYDVIRYKIERYLTLSGHREKYPCTTKKKIKKKTKHTKKVVVENSGAHTQLDVKCFIDFFRVE